MRGVSQAATETERDLSVLVDESLKFQRQTAAAAKANQILAVIRQSFKLVNETTLPRLYKALVYPHLEFSNVASGPFNRADELLLEQVQRRVTHLVASVKHWP